MNTIKNHHPDLSRSCNLLTIIVVVGSTSNIGKIAATPTSPNITIIVHIIGNNIPANIHHQYSEREDLPLKVNDFPIPLFVASIKDIIFSGLTIRHTCLDIL